MFEYYQYASPVRIDPLPQSNPQPPRVKEKKKKDHREESSIRRSRKNIKRLVNANAGFHYKNLKLKKAFMPIFVTLTCKENIQNIKIGNRHYSKFIQRLNHALFKKKKNILKYVAVIEFQKRGAIHYHIIFFNLPFNKGNKKIIEQCWGQGFIKMEAIKKHINNVGNYILKYITKDNADSRLVGKKCYFASKNLIKSAVIKDPAKIAFIMNFVSRQDFEHQRFCENPEFGPAYLQTIYNVEDKGFVRGILDLLVKPGYLDEKL